MPDETKLTIVKIIHTLVWTGFNIVIFYMLYAVITNKADWLLWMGHGLILTEGIVLYAFNNVCPLTIIARRYTVVQPDNFDIYLPNWLARYNKKIYAAIVIVIAILTVYRLLNNHTWPG